MLTAPRNNELKTQLRLANKILNLWIEQNMPHAAEEVITNKKRARAKLLEELALAEDFRIRQHGRLQKLESYDSDYDAEMKEQLRDQINEELAFYITQDMRGTSVCNTLLKELVALAAERIRAIDNEHNEFTLFSRDLKQSHIDAKKYAMDIAALGQTATFQFGSHTKHARDIHSDMLNNLSRLLGHHRATIDSKCEQMKNFIALEDQLKKDIAVYDSKDLKTSISRTLDLFLYPDEDNDEDIPVQGDLAQTQIDNLKELMKHIKNTPIADLAELSVLPSLMSKVLFIIFNHPFEPHTPLDYVALAKWAEIGQWLIIKNNSLGDSLSKKDARTFKKQLTAHNRMIQEKICFLTQKIYAFLAFQLASHSTPSSSNLALAQHYLEHSLEVAKLSKVPSKSDRLLLLYNLCTRLLLADKNNDRDQFVTTMTEIEQIWKAYCHMLTCNPALFKAFVLIGTYWENQNALTPALDYFERALNLMHSKEIANNDNHSLYEFEDVRILTERIKALKTRQQAHTIDELTEKFSQLQVSPLGKGLRFIIPVEGIQPLSSLKGYNSANMFLCLNNENDTPPNCVQIIVKPTASPDAKQEIQNILARIEKALAIQAKSAAQKSNTHSVSSAFSGSLTQDASSSTTESTFLDTPHTPAPLKRRVNKKRAKKAHPPQKPPVPVNVAQNTHTSPPEVKLCRANDFGFTDPSNPPVTPIYASWKAQEKQHAQIFLQWKGIPGVDSTVASQFEEDLNCKPQGLVFTSMVNRAGVKKPLQNPDDLGDNWSLCAIRMKRKGASGFFRALAIPEEKITIIDEKGREENRYLFSIGKSVHK